MKDPILGWILQLSLSIKRVVDLWVNIRQAINVGMSAELLVQYSVMSPSDNGYDMTEKEAAEETLANWWVYASLLQNLTYDSYIC